MSVCLSEVFPMQMEGVRLTVNKGLSNHFQVSPVCTTGGFSWAMLLKEVFLILNILSCFIS